MIRRRSGQGSPFDILRFSPFDPRNRWLTPVDFVPGPLHVPSRQAEKRRARQKSLIVSELRGHRTRIDGYIDSEI
jgi:hypothetical protein